MSGPKLIEMRRRARAARLQKNRDLCDQWDAEYQRLCAEHEQLRNQLRALGVAPGDALDPAESVARVYREMIRCGQDEEAVRRYPHQVEFGRAAVEEARLAVGGRLLECHERWRRACAEAEALLAEPERAAALNPTLRDLLAAAQTLSDQDPDAIARLETAIAAGRAAQPPPIERAKHISKTAQPPTGAGRSIADFLDASPAAAGRNTAAQRYQAEWNRLREQVAALRDARLWDQWRELEPKFLEGIVGPDGESRSPAILAELQAALQQAHERASFRQEAAGLLDSAARWSDAAVRTVADEIEKKRQAGDPIDLAPWRERLQAAIAQAQVRREREARRQAILDSLVELGYQPQEGLQTAFAQGGRLILQKPDDPEYAVECVADAELTKVQTALVRFAEEATTTREQQCRDHEAEQRWCIEHGRWREKLSERGWDASFVMQHPAGQHAVRVMAPAAAGTKAERRADPAQRPRKRGDSKRSAHE